MSATSDIEDTLKNRQNSLDYYSRSLRSSSSEIYTRKINRQIQEEKTIINALERMLPKRPLQEGSGSMMVYFCPICREELSEPQSQKYCENCGQALDFPLHMD
ncbi:ribosomal protein L13 [Anaerotaenia torta]|uniref:hypothetical protein n=1 Tax=Anaerotaenia torta TaxID=433293 RepID=UPI003D1FF15D